MTWKNLKWIAVVSMFIDHLATVLFSQIILMNWGMDLSSSYILLQVLHMIGRIAFPIFSFGIAQGCVYTRDPKRFLGRLALFAVISEIPYNLALRGNDFFFRYFDFNNIFFSLFLGAFCCCIYQFFSDKSKKWAAFLLILPVIILAEVFELEYGGLGVLFVFVPYIFRENKKAQVISLGVIAVLFYFFYAQFNGVEGYWFQWMIEDNLSVFTFMDTVGALIGVGLLALYNGEKGKNYPKWFFYTFYPGHLLFLYFIKFIAL